MNLNDYLKAITFNSSITDLYQLYVDKSKELDLKDDLGYTRKIKKYDSDKNDDVESNYSDKGLFYFSLSVKVFDDSPFIPFNLLMNYSENVEMTVASENTTKIDDDSYKNFVDLLEYACKENNTIASVSIEIDIEQYDGRNEIEKSNAVQSKKQDNTNGEKEKDSVAKLNKSITILTNSNKGENQQKETEPVTIDFFDDLTNSNKGENQQKETEPVTIDFYDDGEKKIAAKEREALQYIEDKIREKIKQDSFIQQLMSIFDTNCKGWKNKNKKLYFRLYAFDSCLQAGNKTVAKLTHYMTVSTNKESTDKDENQDFFYAKVRRVRDIASKIRSKHLENLFIKSRYEAIKAVKAAIMSRNMSHNLGSHVMFYIKQRLESVEQILGSGALQNLVQASSVDDLEKKMKEVCIDENTKQLPFLVGLGRFINYLQERQDYIATIATSHIPYKTSINFKDAIYDELKPEKHALRHGSDTVGRNAANILLDYIAKSEGFEKSDDIVLLFGKGDGTTFDGSGKPEDVPDNLRNFNISLPGGNLGRQAFFSIMENIIRNTAKHDGRRADQLFFQFDILDPDNIKDIDGFSLRYKEKEKKEEEIKLNYKENYDCYKEFKNDFEYLGITIKVDVSEDELNKTMEKINKGLLSRYLCDNGDVNDEYKGIKEIRLSAAWIRGQELDFEIKEEEPPAVSIRKNEIDSKKYLQYVICIPKPKKIAIVSSSLKDNKEYHKMGCKVFEIDKSISDCKKLQKLKGISDYELVVYHGNEYCDKEQKKWDEGYCLVRQHTGSRIFAEPNLGETWTVDGLYTSWLEKAFPDITPKETTTPSKSIKLSILDEQAKNNTSNSDFLTDKIETTASSSDSDKKYYTNNIVFCTHYPGQAEVVKTNEKTTSENGKTLLADVNCYTKARFVEAITGGNSTDRLIRHDERTVEWYCKQMSAGLTHIAIFDERLYSLIMPPEGNAPKEVQDAVNDFFNSTHNPSNEDFANAMMAKFDFVDDNYFAMLMDVLPSIPTKAECIQALSSSIRDYSKTWQYREKGIWTFNIKVDNNKKIDIVGYNTSPQKEQIGVYDPQSDEQVIAHISNDNGNITVKFKNKKEVWKNKFDFISIHQGLLDKIYGALGITGEEWQKREKVTKAIFDAFSSKVGSDFEISNETDDQGQKINTKYFLPQFVIHSGRSKPNRKDMPQNLPFLQFSAIDYAVRDCKYALTELLYSAHYEQ